MTDLLGLLGGMAIAAGLYLLLRYLPRWVGAVPMLAFLGFMGWLMVTRGAGQWLSMLVVLVVGESVLGTIWEAATKAKQKHLAQELAKMQAKDLSANH